MPPSTHYLNLLNLNHSDDPNAAIEFSAEDISKELELFTNSNFLDDDSFYAQPFDAAAYETQSAQPEYSPAQLQRQRSVPLASLDKLQTRYASVPLSSIAVPSQQQQQQQQQQQVVSVQLQAQRGHQQQNIGTQGYQFTQPYAQESYHQADTVPTASPHNVAFVKRSAEEADLFGSSSSSPADGKPRSFEEEDKRRRNTAASARFRIKKKQREQALQEAAKAVSDKNSSLESRIKELELENKWLRSLIKPNVDVSNAVLPSL